MRPVLAVRLMAVWVLMLAFARCTMVQIEDTYMVDQRRTWTAECGFVPIDICEGVAAAFVGMTERHPWIHGFSEGRLRVEHAGCPASPHPDAAASLDLTACWRVDAQTREGQACMLIARTKDPTAAGPQFGLAGGDDINGSLIGPPGPRQTPC